VRVTFLGATGTVTGSKFLVEAAGTRVLVDCGIYQGIKKLRMRNWQRPPVDPGGLDAVLLTHAHIDHSGYLPALVRDGFQGPIHCTPPTRALCKILLPDSGRIHEEDARYANRKRFSRHDPALALYTEEDALASLGSFEPVELGAPLRVGALAVRFQPAGHILGAASVLVEAEGQTLLFSGDLGPADHLLMDAPAPPGHPRWIVMESTYGNRLHANEDPVEAIAGILRRTAGRGGVLLIPSFAVGRAQTLLYILHEIREKGLAPDVPVYVNSPMATDVTSLYKSYPAYHRLSPERCATIFGVAHYVRSVDESKELNARRGPLVILSASGMATGGRVLHHLRALAPDERNTILLPGYQAPGTRGADLAAGAPAITIHGQVVPVRAEVVQLGILSAHADQRDLVGWLGAADREPEGVFLVHGEPAAADGLRRVVRERLGYEPRIPEYEESVELGPPGGR
jgi:metallo-beta-lactamase family protein